jgi:hypothetical protein
VDRVTNGYDNFSRRFATREGASSGWVTLSEVSHAVLEPADPRRSLPKTRRGRYPSIGIAAKSAVSVDYLR